MLTTQANPIHAYGPRMSRKDARCSSRSTIPESADGVGLEDGAVTHSPTGVVTVPLAFSRKLSQSASGGSPFGTFSLQPYSPSFAPGWVS